MQDLLGGMTEFNHRQMAILRHALKLPNATFTVTSHQNSHNVATQTARNDLEGLVDADLLKKIKRGKGFTFLPIPDLEDRLRHANHSR